MYILTYMKHRYMKEDKLLLPKASFVAWNMPSNFICQILLTFTQNCQEKSDIKEQWRGESYASTETPSILFEMKPYFVRVLIQSFIMIIQ